MTNILSELNKRGITLGNLVNFAGLLIAAAGVWFGLVSRVEKLEQRDVERSNDLREMSRTLNEQGRSIVRIDTNVEWMVRTLTPRSPSP